MRRFIIYILLLVSLTYSCQRDHLHYETSRYALVHVEIDWETKSHITPNGVSSYLFDSAGNKYSSALSSDPYNLYLKLPEGEYTLVVHNNSISELNGVHLTGSSHIDTFSIHANDATYESEFETLDNEIFVDEPDDVVSYTLRNIKIESSDIQYHYDKPDLTDYVQEVTHTYSIQPDHIIHVSRIIAYLNGIEYSSSKKPMAVLHGMSGGYYFGAECTSEEDVMEQFEVNISSSIFSLDSTDPVVASTTKVNGAIDILDPEDEDGFSDEELEGMGMAYIDCNTFGMHVTDTDDQHYYLYIRFYLYDGTYTDYEVDVTNYIKTEDTGSNNLHSVEVILSPLPDGGGEPGDGTWGTDSDGDDTGDTGVFDPTTDEWIDIDVNLQM